MADIQKDLLEIMNDYTDGRITSVEEKYGISIPDRVLPTLVTVGDLLDYLEKEVNG